MALSAQSASWLLEVSQILGEVFNQSVILSGFQSVIPSTSQSVKQSASDSGTQSLSKLDS